MQAHERSSFVGAYWFAPNIGTTSSNCYPVLLDTPSAPGAWCVGTTLSILFWLRAQSLLLAPEYEMDREDILLNFRLLVRPYESEAAEARGIRRKQVRTQHMKLTVLWSTLREASARFCVLASTFFSSTKFPLLPSSSPPLPLSSIQAALHKARLARLSQTPPSLRLWMEDGQGAALLQVLDIKLEGRASVQALAVHGTLLIVIKRALCETPTTLCENLHRERRRAQLQHTFRPLESPTEAGRRCCRVCHAFLHM